MTAPVSVVRTGTGPSRLPTTPVWICTPIDPRDSSSEPEPSERGRPALAAAVELLSVAAAASSQPAPTRCTSVTGPGRAVPTSRALTWSGVSDGVRDSTSAAAPETTPLENEVPDPTKCCVPMRAPACSWSIVEPTARVDTTDPPGATRSGLAMPFERVGPAAENAGTVSSAMPGVLASAAEPTVMTHGSSAGLVTVPASGPRLDALTTTTRPAAQARSTAMFSGSMRVSWVESVPSERFTTSMS